MKEVRILLVEDNEGDIVLTMEALKQAKIRNEIDVARDGEEAMQYLRNEGPFADVPSPDIILLDINLPKMDGTEVLSVIKNDEVLKVIPVIMLTTSDAERDVMKSYYNHANCYITKPVDLDKFMEVVQAIKNFWISIVKLPKTQD
ncbi:MAG TPA: response regulator [Chitinophagaceae bacterium]|nr:response regulator [Chitinophagaceae bacterium]